MKKVKYIAIILLFTLISYTILQFLGNKYTYALSQTIDTNVDGINMSAYPGIKERIQELQKKYPNWTFKLLYTNLDWNTVIANEYQGHGSSPKNLVANTRDSSWICSTCGNRAYDNGSWRCASESAIRYIMDPRNFLNETDIFQFEELTGTNAQISIVQSMTRGTFLQGHEQGIVNTANNYQINAYYIVARLIQEQGKSGSTLVSGASGYYNAFNIGASGANSSQIIQNGLAYAKRQGWNTLEKSIDGGIKFVANEYIKKGQNTLYLQKFNVTTNGTYWHQYQQNLTAAGTEGSTLRGTYQDVGAIASAHTFIIPMYMNMPATISLPPELINSNLPTSDLVKINVNSSLKLRKSPEDATLVAWLWKDEVVARLEKGTSKINGTYWDKVQKANGQVGWTARQTFDYESTYKLYLVPLNTNVQTEQAPAVQPQQGAQSATPNTSASPSSTPSQTPNAETITRGDANGDGTLTAGDYVLVKNYIMGTKQFDANAMIRADTNADGKITAGDYVLIKNKIMQ